MEHRERTTKISLDKLYDLCNELDKLSDLCNEMEARRGELSDRIKDEAFRQATKVFSTNNDFTHDYIKKALDGIFYIDGKSHHLVRVDIAPVRVQFIPIIPIVRGEKDDLAPSLRID